MVGTVATDAHRNALPFPLHDGERTDSYRRMMSWFANYVLADAQDLDSIEEAVATGRMYGAFQVFGEPVGFDFYAETAKGVAEMGDEVDLGDGPEFHVALPAFYAMDPDLDPSELHVRVIKAGATGGTVVAESVDEDLDFTPVDPGAYRVEIGIVPYHLTPWLGPDADIFLREYPLIYANPIYVAD
ncbi:MAG: hypothetical protein M5R36_00900 [Deltaproteobacteria bacterium]|nr:hypothetical protein [Deltaproteobacteria bacterium]